MAGPRGVRYDKRAHKRLEFLRSRWMDSEQNDTGLFQWVSALNGNLPEVLLERQHDARLCFGQVQEGDVFRSREISAGPQNVVTLGSKIVDNRLREVLVGEKAHLRWNRECLVFVGEIA